MSETNLNNILQVFLKNIADFNPDIGKSRQIQHLIF
jgi:hypothetical protein